MYLTSYAKLELRRLRGILGKQDLIYLVSFLQGYLLFRRSSPY
jgi:hypothetical protein